MTSITRPHESPCQEFQTQSQSQSQSHYSSSSRSHLSPTPSLPSAPEGTFRLFRWLALYPVPQILLETFPYPERPPYREVNAQGHIADGSNSVGHNTACPPYDAISYAWNPHSDDSDPAGSPIASTQLIQVFTSASLSNSTYPVTMAITTHLLHGLLTSQELCSPTWIFVDAICIDQADVIDKSVQVHGIHRVFRGAERVLIWLGMNVESRTRPRSRSRSAFEMETDSVPATSQSSRRLREGGSDLDQPSSVVWSDTYSNAESILDKGARTDTGSCLNRIPSLVQGLQTYIQSRESSAPVECHLSAGAAGLPSPQDPLWEALELVRLNAWFSRLWVVQEICLARDAVLLYGRYSLPWSMYAQMIALCKRIITRHSTTSQEQAKPELVNCLSAVYNSRVSAMENLKQRIVPTSVQFADEVDDSYRHGTCGSALTLNILINIIRRSKATLALDRVYAVFGLLSDEIRETVQVSYSSDLTHQYWIKWIELVQALLTLVPSSAEQILSNASFLEKHPCLPSWCPNLADDGEYHGLLSLSPTSAGAGRGKKFETDSQSPTLTVCPGGSQISLIGVKLDEVAYVIDLSWIKDVLPWTQIFIERDGDISSDVAQRIVLTFWKCLEHMKELGTSVSDGDALLARCLVANAYDDESPEPEQLLNDYTTFMQYLEHHFWGPTSGGSFKKSTRSVALKYGDRCQKMARKRAFFVTKSGRPGLCSTRAQKGDTLCVFRNFQQPYLLRGSESGTSFELISETYTDGIMHGEALVGRDLRVDNLDRFNIC